jgi:prepilin signal peptidase PulO-like enzyme (type II secretory pathway)
LVEALTGIIFALLGPLLAEAAYSLPFPVGELFGLDYLAVASLFIAIAIHDLRTTTIPDVWVYAFAVLALLSQFLTIVPPGTSVGLILLAGPIAALPLFALWLYSRGAWMGFGDVKLALGIGWLLGPVYGIAAVLFSFVLGAAVSVPLLFFSSSAWQRLRARLTHTGASSNATLGFTIGSEASYGRRSLGSEGESSLRSSRWTMKSEIPFGPFLVASTLIVWLLLIHQLDPLAFVGLSS